ncbi:MAG: prolipoprotein diacylglyceryl transferase family protein [Owenweeksia sp.]|nr:prolipoprotein diacylglyceryl transferase family protein [Owenweeksia sp.]
MKLYRFGRVGWPVTGPPVGIILAVIIYCKRVLHRSTLWMLDRLVLTIALAAMLIRLGNWFNSEIYGQPANSATQTVFLNPARERVSRCL